MKTRKMTQKSTTIVMMLVLSTSLFFSSCEKEQLTRIGFNTTFDQRSRGLTVADVEWQADILYLQGVLRVDVGEVKIELLDGQGNMVYARNFNSPGVYEIRETFKANTGYWKFRYISLEGKGNICLHLEITEFL